MKCRALLKVVRQNIHFCSLTELIACVQTLSVLEENTLLRVSVVERQSDRRAN
jgi:hypothetical protein